MDWNGSRYSWARPTQQADRPDGQPAGRPAIQPPTPTSPAHAHAHVHPMLPARTNRELEEAKAIFAEKEGKSVEEWVEGDTSGFYTTFLLRCLQAKRQEGLVDERLAGIQARAGGPAM